MTEISVIQWVVMGLAAIFLGVSRTGIRGSTMLAIPIFAEILGARVSSGIVLILFVVGDGVAIRHYYRNTHWATVFRLFPWALLGIVAGAIVGGSVSELVFRRIMGAILLGSSLMLIRREVRGREVIIPGTTLVSGLLGTTGGFTSMVGNAAGPLMNLYLLSKGYNKEQFIGTTAWFFFLMNVTKVPFHLFYWKTVTVEAIPLLAILAIPILAGAAVGVWVARALPERPFRVVIVALAAVASLRLLLF
jgi:uncharacterized protein